MQVVLLQVARAGVASVVERLAEHGIAAEVVDHPNSFALLVSYGTYRVRIAVDEADESRAREILDAWNAEARPRVDELSRTLLRDALVALVPALGVGLALFLAGPWGRIASGFAVLAAWLVAMRVLGRRRRASGPPI